MKRIITLLLALLLTLSCCTAAAEETAEPLYATTKSFMALMEDRGMPTTYIGTDDNNNDVLTFGLYLEQLDRNVLAYLHFQSDLECCSIYMWDLIEIDIGRLGELLIECNNLNRGYRYIGFTVDVPNQAVHARTTFSFTEGTAAFITDQYLDAMFAIVEMAMPTLMEYEP